MSEALETPTRELQVLTLLHAVIQFYERAHTTLADGDADALDALIGERDALLARVRQARDAGSFRLRTPAVTDALGHLAELESGFVRVLTVAVAQRGRELAQSRSRRADAGRYR